MHNMLSIKQRYSSVKMDVSHNSLGSTFNKSNVTNVNQLIEILEVVHIVVGCRWKQKWSVSALNT